MILMPSIKIVGLKKCDLQRGIIFAAMLVASLANLSACSSGSTVRASSNDQEQAVISDSEYVIGAGDSLEIFVWDHADLSTAVQVRPDGKISTPLVEDLQAAGRTPTQLARDIEAVLSEYVRGFCW
jgi:polysaccharide export outer membrane protein